MCQTTLKKLNLKIMKQFFIDETGKLSMKRLCGLLCTVALCVTMYHNSFSPLDQAPSTTLVDAVALLAFGCLGLSSVDKVWGGKKKSEPDTAE